MKNPRTMWINVKNDFKFDKLNENDKFCHSRRNRLHQSSVFIKEIIFVVKTLPRFHLKKKTTTTNSSMFHWIFYHTFKDEIIPILHRFFQ